MITNDTHTKTFSDLIYYYSKIGDTDYSKADIVKRCQVLMEPIYVHLWMILRPTKDNHEGTNKNISDLSTWLLKCAEMCYKENVTLMRIYTALEGGYLRHVKSELVNNHGYRDLVGISGDPISLALEQILSEINHNMTINRKKSKSYMIEKSDIQDIIKDICEIETK